MYLLLIDKHVVCSEWLDDMVKKKKQNLFFHQEKVFSTYFLKGLIFIDVQKMLADECTNDNVD